MPAASQRDGVHCARIQFRTVNSQVATSYSVVMRGDAGKSGSALALVLLTPGVKLLLGFVRVNQAAGPKCRHDFGQAGIGDCEAAQTSTEHTGVAVHVLIHVPGSVYHNRP